MLSDMTSWRRIRVCIFLGFAFAQGGLTTYSSPANTFSPVSNHTSSNMNNLGAAVISTTASITSPGGAANTSKTSTTITSCVPFNILTYLEPSLLALPPTALLASLESGLSKINSDYANIERYQNSPITDTVAFASYLSSEGSALTADVSSLFGASGFGILTFQNIAATDPCLFSACFTSYLSESSASATLLPPGTFFDDVYKASPPCCGQCTIQATGVEIAYWPTPAPTPPVSLLVNANNVSYVSPSVYVFLTSVNAGNLCGPIGENWNVFTSYRPNELSTSPIATSFSGVGPSLGLFTPINYADFDSPKCLCTTNCVSDPIQHSILTNICTPQLSLPPGIDKIDPLWSTCVFNSFGVFDPPLALRPQAGLTTPNSTPATTTSNGASPPATTPPTTPAAETSPTPTTPIPPATTPPGTTIVLPPVNSPPINSPPVNSPPVNSPPVNNPPVSSNPAPAPAPPVSLTNAVTTTVPPPLVLNGQTITANSQGDFVVGSQTLTANSEGDIVVGTETLTAGGSDITESGTTFSLGPEVTQVVVGGTSTTELGSVIESAPPQYTGAAVKGGELGAVSTVWVVLALSALVVWL